MPNVVMMTGETISITESVTELLGIGTVVLDFIMGHALLSTLFAGCLVGVGCYVVKKVKRVAKS